jgi:hypothetical protein
MTYINAFTSSVLQRIVKASSLDPNTIAGAIGYKDGKLVQSWINGGNIPPLKRLVSLANAVNLPLEDLLTPWLCDQDPANHARYEIIAAQLGGEAYAADLVSGQDENSERPWWQMKRKPASAAEIASRKEVPPGVYADTRGS